MGAFRSPQLSGAKLATALKVFFVNPMRFLRPFLVFHNNSLQTNYSLPVRLEMQRKYSASGNLPNPVFRRRPALRAVRTKSWFERVISFNIHIKGSEPNGPALVQSLRGITPACSNPNEISPHSYNATFSIRVPKTRKKIHRRKFPDQTATLLVRLVTAGLA